MRTPLFCTLVLFLSAGPVLGQMGLDPSFGTNGQVVTDIEGADNAGTIVLPTDDEKILIVGINTNLTGFHNDFALVRYNSDGTLDASFGDNGVVTTDFGEAKGEDVIDAVLQTDGKIVVVGAGNDGDFVMARYNPDGILDADFGDGGLVVTDVSGDYDQAESVVVQEDGKIVVGGTVGGSPSHLGLARYNSDGSLDDTFGTGGLVVGDAGFDPVINTILVQPDGKIVGIGNNYPNGFTEPDPLVARYNADGTPDTEFGEGGVVTPVTDAFEFINDAVLQDDGKIVIIGGSRPSPGPGNNALLLQRYMPDGTFDSSFGTDGVSALTVGNGMGFNAVTLQPDGKFVVGGTQFQSAYIVVRVNSDGSLDTTLGDNGVISTPGNGELRDVAFQADDKLVATGYAEKGAPPDFLDMITFRFDVGVVETASEDETIPRDAFVVSNYPNPFSSLTNVRLELANAGRVTVAVYDMQGREVATLLDAERQAGVTEAQFAPGSLSAGTYMYQVRIDGAVVDTRPMTYAP